MLERLALAKELGADYVVNPENSETVSEIKRLCCNAGADIAIGCVGANQAINDALDSTKAMGNVGLIGEMSKATINPSKQLLRKLLNVKGCWYFNKSDWGEICEIIKRKQIPLSKISTRTFKLEEAVTAFELFDSGKTQKVVFTWDD